MLQKKSVYVDAFTDNTETCDSDSQVTPYAEEVEQGEEQTSVTEEPQKQRPTLQHRYQPRPSAAAQATTHVGPKQPRTRNHFDTGKRHRREGGGKRRSKPGKR